MCVLCFVFVYDVCGVVMMVSACVRVCVCVRADANVSEFQNASEQQRQT